MKVHYDFRYARTSCSYGGQLRRIAQTKRRQRGRFCLYHLSILVQTRKFLVVRTRTTVFNERRATDFIYGRNLTAKKDQHV